MTHVLLFGTVALSIDRTAVGLVCCVILLQSCKLSVLCSFIIYYKKMSVSFEACGRILELLPTQSAANFPEQRSNYYFFTRNSILRCELATNTEEYQTTRVLS